MAKCDCNKIKQQWGNLTEEDLAEINGRRDLLLNKIQQRYGLNKEAAERELREWEKAGSKR